MHKIRCPHCGEKTFSSSDRIYIAYTFFWKWGPHKSADDRSCRCRSCNGYAVPQEPPTFLMAIFFPLYLTRCIPVLLLAAIALWLGGAVHWAVAAAMALYHVAFYLQLVLYPLKKPLLPTNRDGRYVLTKPQVKVTVNDAKHIKNYGVYGLKFKTQTVDESFSENFRDRMIPAMFRRADADSLTYDISVIKFKFVPKDLLFNGAKFLVEDYDGIFIAKGTVNKIDFDNADEE